VISKKAKAFWALLKSFPKQIEMPLSKARESDLLAEYLTSEPSGVTYSPAPEVDGFWATIECESSGRTILYFFGGGYMVGNPATRRKQPVISLLLPAPGSWCRITGSRPSIHSQPRSRTRC